ncbi:MAG TPA: PIN domain-containing protein [Candidatus Korarchaeota archaeon]|nr:PIN domain-containing protein [Candidatus Korarchaeota archaeon]
MKFIFDASSIVNLIKRGLTSMFMDGATTSLALYESLNAVWKECRLLGRIDESTALSYVDILSDVFIAIDRLTINGVEEEIFKIALKEGLTIYDASYIYLASDNNLTLVTDDKKLEKKASKLVKVVSSSELAKAYVHG